MSFQTQSARLRSLTVSTLIAQNTLAGPHVEAERTLPLDDGELPHINVFVDESGDSFYQGGPRFKVTAKLQIKATVQRALFADLLPDLDTIIYQIKEALLADPVWIVVANQVLSFGITSSFKSEQNQQQGEALISISCEWVESVALRVGVPLTGENLTIQPGQAGVTAPVRAVINIPSA